MTKNERYWAERIAAEDAIYRRAESEVRTLRGAYEMGGGQRGRRELRGWWGRTARCRGRTRTGLGTCGRCGRKYGRPAERS